MATNDGYSQYRQSHEYGQSTGTVIAPSSNRSGAARLLRLGGAYGTRTVSFDATRNGMPPILPAAEDTDGDTFVSGSVTLPLPIPDTRGGGYTFHGAGRYTYLQNKVRAPGTDPLPTGSYPFTVIADYVAIERLRGLSGFAAAVTDPDDPDTALLTLAGSEQFDDDNPQFGWHLTGFPSEAFTVTTISG